MDLFSLAARLTLDKSDYDQGIKEAEQRGKTFVNRIGNTVGKAAKAVAVAGGAVATAAATTTVKIIKDAFGEYGELEQNLGGSEVVFAKYAKKIQQIGAEAYKNMGLSQSDFLANANKMGSLLKGSGFTDEAEVAVMATEWMQRAADVASIMGVSIEDAMTAVTGAAKGNFTMMDNLGVAMNATTLEAYALSKGIAKSYSEMSQAEKIGLAYDYFMEQTSDYAGNYAKENDTLVGSITSLKAAWSNFLSGAGDADAVVDMLDNVLESISSSADTLIPRLAEGFSQIVGKLAPKLPNIIKKIMPAIVKGMTSIMSALPGVLKEVATGAANGIISLLNEAFGWNIPELKDIRWPSWDDVKGTFNTAWGWIKSEASKVMQLVFGANPDGSIKWPQWKDVEDAFNIAWNWIKDEASKVMQLVFGQNPDGSIKWPEWKNVSDAFDTAWGWIKDQASTLMQLVFGANPDGSIKWPEWKDISDAFDTFWKGIKQSASDVMELVFGPDGIHWPDWDTVWQGAYAAWEDIKTHLKDVWKFFFGSDSIKFPDWSTISQAASSTLEDIRQGVNGALKTTLGISIPPWPEVEKKYGPMMQRIVNGVKGILNPEDGSTILGSAWETLSGVLSTIYELGTDASGVIGNIFQKLGQGLQGLEWEPLQQIGSVVEWLGDILTAINENADTIKNVLDDILAAVIAIKAINIGKNFWAGLTGNNPVGGLFGNLLGGGAGNAAGSAAGSAAGGAAGNAGGGLAYNAGKWLRNGWMSAKNFATSLPDKLAGINPMVTGLALTAAVTEATKLINAHQTELLDNEFEARRRELQDKRSRVSSEAQGAVDWAIGLSDAAMSQERSGYVNRRLAGNRWGDYTDVYSILTGFGESVYPLEELYEGSGKYTVRSGKQFENLFGADTFAKYKNWLEEGMPNDTQFMELAGEMTDKITEMTTAASSGSEDATAKLEAFNAALNKIPDNTTKNVSINVGYSGVWDSMFGGIADIMGSHADGLNYVPYDGYLAELHRGEQVLSAANARKGGGGFDSAAMYSSVANAISEAMRGVSVNLNGEAVGSMMTPYVSRNIAQAARARRYTP